MKQDQLNFVKTHSYRELFNQATKFLQATSFGDVEEAKSIRNNTNHKIGKVYDFVINMLESKRETEKHLEQLKLIARSLNKEVKQLKSQTQGITKKSVPKKGEYRLSSQERIKLNIIEALEDGFMYEAKLTAVKNGFKDLEGPLQRAYEHKWIESQLKRKQQNLKRLPPKEESITLSRQFELVRNSILTDQLEKVLSQLVNSSQRIDFQNISLPFVIKTYLKDLEKCLHPQKKVAQQECKVIKYLQKYFPDFQHRQEQSNFYSIIIKFIERQSKSERASLLGSIGNETQYTRKQFNVPQTLQTYTSSDRDTKKHFSQQTQKKLKRLINSIDLQCKKAGFQRDQNQTTDNQIEILNRAKSIIAKYTVFKDINSTLVKDEEVVMENLISINNKILEFVRIDNPIEICAHQNNLSSAMKAFLSNFEEVMISLKNKIALRTSLSLSDSPRTLGKAFVLTYEEHDQSEEERYEKALNRKQKYQLIEMIMQLRNALDDLEKQNDKKKQHERLMQNRIKKLDQSVKESLILIESSISPNQGDQFLMEELTLAKRRLMEELDRKTTEMEQLKNSIPRLIEDARFKIQLQKNKLIMEKKNMFEEDLRDIQKKNKKLKAEKLTLEMKVEELMEENKKKMAAENYLTKKQEDIGRKQGDSFTRDKKQELSNYIKKSQPQHNIQPQQVPNLSLTLNQKHLGFIRTSQISIFSTASSVEKNNILLQEIDSLKNKIEELNSQLNQLKEALFEKSRQIEDQRIRLEEYDTSSNQKDILVKELSKDLENMKAKTKLQEEQVRQQTGHLFSIGSIFDVDSEDRNYLIKTLTNHLGPIRKTNLLYRYDPFNKTNPHKYIDKQEHLVFIFKTIFGKYVAAYSRQMIDPAGSKAGFGLLISIWNRNTYEVINKKRSVTYDDYFVIFGNSELRLKSLQTKIFSNFGINNGYFNSRGHKVDDFLGEGRDRQVPLSAYEFYSLELTY